MGRQYAGPLRDALNGADGGAVYVDRPAFHPDYVGHIFEIVETVDGYVHRSDFDEPGTLIITTHERAARFEQNPRIVVGRGAVTYLDAQARPLAMVSEVVRPSTQ